MSDASRVEQLLEETLESGRPAEEVCAQFPQLLWQVTERLRQCQSVEAQIDALFPPSSDGMAARRRRLISADDSLPQIPGYQVEAVLGRGGVGVVHRARHIKLNRYVALKMLLSGAYADPHELARFMREAQAIASLRHAHIVQVYDVGEWEGKPYFTMEMMEGGSLARKLAGAPQPARQAATLLVTLATAAHAAHLGGVVHRDLKPSNILLTADGIPKISDFGLARRLAPDATMTEAAAHGGTPSYMAPEQALGKVSAIGPATDIYGLGAILYELLTGRPPFRAESASETQRQLISKDPVAPSRLNSKVPRDLETICLKCLRKEPESRYASAAELADDLQRFLERRPIRARPPSLAGRAWRWGRREPAAAALIALAFAFVALVLGTGFWAQQQRAAARAMTAQQEQAVEAALARADELATLGHWPEARRALDSAPVLLGPSVRSDLRQRLRQARADADVVNRLEEVRLRLSEGTPVQGRQSPVADRLYAEAFASYGITLKGGTAASAAGVINGSHVRGILLVFLHDWLYWAPVENRNRLAVLLDQVDSDPWRREFRHARARNDIDALELLALAPEIKDQPPALLSGLGGALFSDGQPEQARALLRTAQQHYPGDFYINYLLGRSLEEVRPLDATGYFRAAVAVRPGSDQANARLSAVLQRLGDSDAAIGALKNAVTANPTRVGIAALVKAMAPKGRLEEVRVIWKKMVESNPPDNDSWYGYAQLCLILHKEDEYRRSREAMLRRFAQTNDWIVAERTSGASLLLPDPPEQLRFAAALADQAVLAASKASEPANAYVQFVKGLAEYRMGRLKEAIPYLQDSTQKNPGRPGPQLVLAMIQFRSGSPKEARKALAAAVTTYDWQQLPDDFPSVWTSHILRREAESMILPNLNAFLEGKYRPQENEERLALLPFCQAQELYGTCAKLYADAFVADPSLAENTTADSQRRAALENDRNGRINILRTEPRYLAARCAALAGCGLGKELPKLNEAQRTVWRKQALDWLQADLSVWTRTLDSNSPALRDVAKTMLTLWLIEPDMARLRDPSALNEVSGEEREAWTSLWGQVRSALRGRHVAE